MIHPVRVHVRSPYGAPVAPDIGNSCRRDVAIVGRREVSHTGTPRYAREGAPSSLELGQISEMSNTWEEMGESDLHRYVGSDAIRSIVCAPARLRRPSLSERLNCVGEMRVFSVEADGHLVEYLAYAHAPHAGTKTGVTRLAGGIKKQGDHLQGCLFRLNRLPPYFFPLTISCALASISLQIGYSLGFSLDPSQPAGSHGKRAWSGLRHQHAR